MNPAGHRPERDLRPVRRRQLRRGGGRAVAGLRRAAGAQRRPRRAADARRLRQLLAVHAGGRRPVRLGAAQRAGAVRGRARAAPRAVRATSSGSRKRRASRTRCWSASGSAWSSRTWPSGRGPPTSARSIRPTPAAARSCSGWSFPIPAWPAWRWAVWPSSCLDQVLRRTYLGKAIRATAEDWRAAALAGIDIRRTYLLTFGIGAALAGVAGLAGEHRLDAWRRPSARPGRSRRWW